MDAHCTSQARQQLQRGDVGAALQGLQAALTASPPWPQSLKLLARLALHQQQRALAAQALDVLEHACQDDAEVHALRAAEAKLGGDAAGVEAAARRALALQPGDPLATALLAEALRDQLRIEDAITAASAAIAGNPADWGSRLARADARLFAGDADRAAEDADAATRSTPALAARQLAALARLYLDEPARAGEATAAARATLDAHQALARGIPPLRLPPPAALPVPGTRPLRVALLSPDLRRHPVGQFVEPLLTGHDPARLQLLCFSDGAPDAASARLRALATGWHDIRGRSDADVAGLMRQAGIDVLLDLAGHTSGSRPQLLASRVAARQYGWLGYLFDPGFASCDGVIGDAANLPPGTPSARTALQLPGSFLCHLPPNEAPPVAVRNDGPVVFGSFNHLAKLSPRTVALWTRTVDAVPGSRLALCALGLADAGTRERIRARFVAAGLAPDRLDLWPPVTARPSDFLALYDRIDIALDPLPFNGGTTTLQALWQGVPVLTRPGVRMAARSGASILRQAGLDDWIAADDAAFVALARRWATDVDARRQLRTTLRERLVDSGLCDARLFASGFAGLLEHHAHP